MFEAKVAVAVSHSAGSRSLLEEGGVVDEEVRLPSLDLECLFQGKIVSDRSTRLDEVFPDAFPYRGRRAIARDLGAVACVFVKARDVDGKAIDDRWLEAAVRQ